MSNCSVCGKGDANIICDNSCGTGFCSHECCVKDTHSCSDCPQCQGSVLKQPDGLWKCNKCNFKTYNEEDLENDDLETVVNNHWNQHKF